MNISIKKTIIKVAFFVFISSAFSCVSSGKFMNNENFKDIMDKDWNLKEIQKGGDTITINRMNIPSDIYTVRFEYKRLVGVGAPNRYRALYYERENHGLSIGRIASTRIAALYEMKNFTEYEYFECLQKVTHWYILRNGSLELISNDKGAQVILIFF